MMEEYKKELRKKHFRKAKLDQENTEKEIAAELKSLRHAEKNHAMNSFADMSAPGGMVNSRNMRRVTIGSCRPPEIKIQKKLSVTTITPLSPTLLGNKSALSQTF